MSPDHSPAFLRLDGLQKSYGERVALAGLTLDVARGEILGILGPNGAGKTTTFQILTGLLQADAGRIFVGGEARSPLDGRMRQKLGVVFQEPSLDDKLSGRENLQLGAALFGLPRAEAERKIVDALKLVELSDRAADLVQTYSGGMRRRLELARVLLADPEILILDEPSRGVDQATLRKFWAQVVELRQKRRVTILVTTHHPDEAEYCDRIAILDEGRLVACDTPDALRTRVGGDVVRLRARDPQRLHAAVQAWRADLPARLDGEWVSLTAERGHELIPRLVELMPDNVIAVEFHRPTLADVFLALTGRGLEPEGASA